MLRQKSLLVSLVLLVDRLPWLPEPARRARGRPHTYSDRLILKALVVMIIRRLYIVDHGEVRRSRMGVTIQPVTADIARSLNLPSVKGALVNSVEPGSPAAKPARADWALWPALGGTGAALGQPGARRRVR